MKIIKTNIKKQFILLGFILFFGLLLISICSFYSLANAADYPGVEEGKIQAGNTATTDMNVRIDDEQLSFTAPSVINFSMRGDGSFITPNDGVAYIKNNSVMAIKVIKYDITCDEIAHGVADIGQASGNNSYAINIKPNSGGSVRPFAVSSSQEGMTRLGNDWVMQKSGTKDADTLALSFSDGKMINVTDGTWASPNGHALQKVLWTVSANIS